MAGGAETNYVMHHKVVPWAARTSTPGSRYVGTIEGGEGSVPDVRNPPL